MKIKLLSEHRAQLTTLRPQLATILKKYQSSNSELSRLVKRRDELVTEITRLEKADDLESDEAASKLATRRIQLESVGNKISQIENVPAESSASDQDAALNVLRTFARAATAATSHSIDEYINEIAAKIRPYCTDEISARGAALQVPAVKSLMGTYNFPFGSYIFSIQTTEAAITRCDEILSGNLNWSFDSKQ